MSAKTKDTRELGLSAIVFLAGLCCVTLSKADSRVELKLGQYPLYINNTYFGVAWVKPNHQASHIFVEATVVEQSNLNCSKQTELGVSGKDGILLCEVNIKGYSISDGQRLFVEVDAASYSRATYIEAGKERELIEEAPSSIGGFASYDINATKFTSGRSATSIHPRLGVVARGHMLEAEGAVKSGTFTNDQSDAQGGSGVSSEITSFAYKREWFEKRLRLSVGRNSTNNPLTNGMKFDGLELTRFNSDNQGYTEVPPASIASGYLSSPGVALYRVGGKVLREIPIPAGPYSIDPSIFSSLPSGGEIEIEQLNGETQSHKIAVASVRPIRLYKKSAYDWSMQIGEIREDTKKTPASTVGGAFGLTNETTIGGWLGITGKGQKAVLELNSTFPLASTVFNHKSTFNRRKDDGTGLGGTSVQNTGFVAIGSTAFSAGVDYLTRDKGYYKYDPYYIGPVYDDLRSSVAGFLSWKLTNTGFRSFLRVSKIVSGEPGSSTNNINFGFTGPAWGGSTWNVNLFSSKSDGSRRDNSVFAALTIPLQGGVAFTTQFQKPDKSKAYISETLSGQISGDTFSKGSYSLMGGSDGTISASASIDNPSIGVSASMFSTKSNGSAANLSARGGAVIVDDAILPARYIGDSFLILRSKDLIGESVFVNGEATPATKFDSDGYAVVTNGLMKYRKNSVRVSEENTPLGMVVEDDVFNGKAIRPNSSYEKVVNTRFVKPVRLYLNIPKRARELGGTFVIGPYSAPLEKDASIYIEDLDAITERWGRFEWRDATQHVCSIDMHDLRSAIPTNESKEAFVKNIRNIDCKE